MASLKSYSALALRQPSNSGEYSKRSAVTGRIETTMARKPSRETTSER
jgi:hypothetical protein